MCIPELYVLLSKSRRPTAEFLSVAMFVMARFVLGLGIPFAIVGGSSLIGGQWINHQSVCA